MGSCVLCWSLADSVSCFHRSRCLARVSPSRCFPHRNHTTCGPHVPPLPPTDSPRFFTTSHLLDSPPPPLDYPRFSRLTSGESPPSSSSLAERSFGICILFSVLIALFFSSHKMARPSKKVSLTSDGKEARRITRNAQRLRDTRLNETPEQRRVRLADWAGRQRDFVTRLTQDPLLMLKRMLCGVFE